MTDVSLSEEQELLVDTCRRLVDRHRPATPPEGQATLDESAWQALLEIGLIALAVPESLGGGGARALDAVLVAEQLARGPLAVPFVGTTLALDLLVAGAGDGATSELVEQIATGGRAGIVLGPDLSGHGPGGTGPGAGVAVDARPGDPVVGLHGTPDGDAQVVVGRAGAALDSIDLARPLAAAALHDALPTTLDRSALSRHHAFALAMVCGDLLGSMHAALDGAVAHARDRVQFGRPVGSFQAVQHLCADALVSVESARSITWYAAWAVDALDPAEGLAAARVAKAHCSEAAVEVVETAVQVWGGLGITWECPAHLFQRRALLSRRLFGDEHHHLERLAADLLDGPGRDGEPSHGLAASGVVV